MRTPIAVEGLFLDSSDSPCSGTLCLTPFGDSYNPNDLFSQSPVCGTFDLEGRLVAQSGLALNILASDDVSTVPEVFYIFQLKLDGQDFIEFNAAVPSTSTANDSSIATVESSAVVVLSDLVVSISMVGQSIVGDNWPGGTTVLSIDAITNTLTLSADSTVTGTCSGVVGGAANFSDLQENAL